MRRIFIFMVLALMAISVGAVPAKRGQVRKITLTDGSSVEVRLVGDEFGHYWLADDGRAFVCVGDDETYVTVDLPTFTAKAKERRSMVNAQRRQRLQSRRLGSARSAITGTKKGIIILVNFKNKVFQSANNQALFDKIANLSGYSDGNFKGSMHDYFYDQSLGQFDLTFDVVGPVTVSQNYSYYGGNASQPGTDNHPATMVIEACQLANDNFNVDFSKYDWDGDKYVDQVYVVYAGMGEADGGAPNTIWPHEYDLSSANYYGDGSGPLHLDGVTINTYACGAELNGSETISGIGTMCHEFSHCLGYPDFYDTSDNGDGNGMFCWDLMDYGSYNGGGYQPAGYTSYERWVAGWTEPTVLSASQEVVGMPSLQESGESYIIYNNGNRDEYFLFENRQQVKWDASLPGSGLLIVHVDYNKNAWENNTVNTNKTHQRMTWVPADNNYNYDYDDEGYRVGQASDLFPYGNHTQFNKTSTPAAKFFNKNSDGTYYMDSSVEDITRNSDGTISFNFVGLSNVATPTFSPKAGAYTEAQQVTISCSTEGATIHYTVDGTTPTTASPVYSSAIPVEATTTINAIAVKDGEQSNVATARYVIREAGEVTQFKRVTSTSEMVSGLRYIIVCGSKSKAAGALSNSLLSPEDVTVSGDIVTIGEGVTVFTLDGSNGSYSFINEDGQYLYATGTKKLAYSDDEKKWTVSNDNSGVIMTYDSYGTMLYNVNSPRFTTYTSSPNASMIYANLYMETTEKLDVTLSFDPAAVTATLGETFTAPTLTTNPSGLSVTYTSSEPTVASVTTDGIVTLNATGTTTITATFAGNDSYNGGSASYTLTVQEKGNETVATGRYQLVTSLDDLEEGKNYLIVSEHEGSHYSYDGFDSNKGAVGSVTPDATDVIDLNISSNQAVPVVLSKSGNVWTIFDTDAEAYIGTTTSTSTSSKSHLTAGYSATTNYYKWSIDIESNVAVMKNAGKDYYLKYNHNSGSGMFRVYTSGMDDLYLYKEIEEAVTPETIDVVIGNTHYATVYYGEKNLIVPDGVVAYTYTVSEGKLQQSWLYETGDVIPAGTGVVLKGEPATYTFTVTTESGDVDTDNLLLGFDEDGTTTAGPGNSDDNYYFYKLNTKNGANVGFYWGAPNGAPFVSKAHKAYMAVDKEQAKQVQTFFFDESTNSIVLPTTAGTPSVIYDLQGRRYSTVTSLAKGIYVVDGRKMVIK